MYTRSRKKVDGSKADEKDAMDVNLMAMESLRIDGLKRINESKPANIPAVAKKGKKRNGVASSTPARDPDPTAVTGIEEQRLQWGRTYGMNSTTASLRSLLQRGKLNLPDSLSYQIVDQEQIVKHVHYPDDTPVDAVLRADK